MFVILRLFREGCVQALFNRCRRYSVRSDVICSTCELSLLRDTTADVLLLVFFIIIFFFLINAGHLFNSQTNKLLNGLPKMIIEIGS